MPESLNLIFFGNSLLSYLICAAIFLGISFAAKVFKIIFLKRLKSWAEKTSNTLDDFLVEIIEKIAVPFLYLFGLYLGIKSLTLNDYLVRIINTLAIAVLTVFSVRLIIRLVNYGFEVYWHKSDKGQSLKHSLSGVLKVVKFSIWVLALIFYLDNLGFKITTVIAGLGIGGVAIALAAQAVLKDLFSYFAIVIDRPFEIGDFIIVGDLLGTVEHVGIKTTRIRSLGGEELVFSNSDLTDSRLRNYKRMQKRRVVFHLGVTYDTPLSKLKEMPGAIAEIIKKVKDALFDRAHFSAYGDFNLVFEVVYYVLSSDYNKYMDIQQEINFSIKAELEKRGIEFAFPTQTVHLAK
ncbi:MAG: mechanosensitive ion channel family protein [Candidatus Omnitrophica bacterium]|nr:mechanosensitive ion channel family protein [Candidatus Omnitrophota bacterium]MBU2250639.1 mechanosensitive ion channel family protein [Candidatus Omnitrophota bacterium]MBU2473376.1 mechanosensitive ion channel family protein [Candidatus Omnitrophota bacterium]